MKLEFADIFDKELKQEVKTIEKAIDGAFNKKEKKYEINSKKSEKYFFTSICLLIFSFICMLITDFFLLNVLLFMVSILVTGCILHTDTKTDNKISKERKEAKLITNLEIFNYYKNKRKHLNGKKLQKATNALTPKQKEILKYIQKYNLYKAEFKKIQNMLIEEKLDNVSESEYKVCAEQVEAYIYNLNNPQKEAKLNKKVQLNFPPPKRKKKEIKKVVLRSNLLEKI